MQRAAMVALAGLLAAAAPAAGQGADTLVSLSDGVYTEAQARRGQAVYEEACASCHLPEYFTGTFLESWEGAPLSLLFDLIRTTMPQDTPGALERSEYADVLAYIFELNDVPDGDRELRPHPEALTKIVIEIRRRE